MGFDTIIANGRVVTATDTYTSDVAITAGKIAAIGQNLPRKMRAGVDAAGKTSCLDGNRCAHAPRYAFAGPPVLMILRLAPAQRVRRTNDAH